MDDDEVMEASQVSYLDTNEGRNQELKMIEYRLNKLRSDKHQGILPYERESIETNTIAQNLLSFLDQVDNGKLIEKKLEEKSKPAFAKLFILFSTLTMFLFFLAGILLNKKNGYDSIPEEKALIVGTKNSILFDSNDDVKYLYLHFKSKNTPEKIKVAIVDWQTSYLEFSCEVYNKENDEYHYLPVELDSTVNVNLEEDINCFSHGYFQLTEYDFDSDKDPEILIAYGDGSVYLTLFVFKYYPPQDNSDAGREQNLELVGTIQGQSKIKIKDKSIIVPYGGQNLVDEYIYIRDKFIPINE